MALELKTSSSRAAFLLLLACLATLAAWLIASSWAASFAILVPQAQAIVIKIRREASQKLDNLIGGTAWIDQVYLKDDPLTVSHRGMRSPVLITRG